MHLKSCCALLLLALVACQAAPSTTKNIEKKSISEKTSKIEKDDMKLEDPGMDKDRSKKSTTFCVEVHDGVQQQVPCKESQQLVLVQPEPVKQTILHQPQPTLLNYPVKLSEPQIQPVHVFQPQPQPIHVIQQQPQSVQLVQTQPQPPQTLHIQQPVQQPAQPVFVMPPPQLPAAQPAPQAPIVNILTPPAAPCNIMPAPTVIREEHKQTLEVPKPEPVKQELPRPKPVPVEFLPIVEPVPCKQELVVLPSRPLPAYPEKHYAVQLTEVEPRPEPVVEAECTCKGHPSWPRHHHKVHEHHVMIQPAPTSVMPASPLFVQPPCPASYLNSQPNIFGGYV